LRATLLYLVGYVGRDSRTIADARTLAERYLQSPAGIDPDLAATALELAATTNDPVLYERYRAQLKPDADPQEYYRYLEALTYFTEPSLVDRTLALTLEPELRSQDAPAVIADLAAKPESRERTWRFVAERWQDLESKLGVFQGISRVVGAAASFCSVDAKQDVERFFQAHPVPSAERTLLQVLETIQSCAEMRARQEGKLSAWLSATPQTR
jgi:aminopeptidase N/puromycin-sensitive aminopeptidase